MISNYLKYRKTPILFALISIAFYISFGYDLERADFIKLMMLYGGLFFLFYKMVQLAKWDFKFLAGTAILFRLIFLFAIPNLSQDFYRFVWDSSLLLKGINPYLYTPNFLMQLPDFNLLNAPELFAGMGSLSANHFSNYPPLNQVFFAIASKISGNSILGPVVVMRTFIILADVGTLYFGKKLLKNLNIPVHNIFWYVLNPFIIIELTGNLHFEGMMLFFVIWALYLLQQKKWKSAALALGLSVSVKLVPLVFLPLFYQQLKFKKWFWFCAIVIGINIVLFLPFLSFEFAENYGQTTALWFLSFEFNGSVYYLLRESFLALTENKIIDIYGIVSPVLVVVLAIWLSFTRKNKNLKSLITNMLLMLTGYYFLATTVHPWYIASLLVLSVFTNYKFPLVWGLMVFLSYSAYGPDGFKENYWLIALEYLMVFGVFVWEVFFQNRKKETY